MKKTSSILKEARELIAKGWCQGALAATKAGKPTHPGSIDAAQFCSLGALWRCSFGSVSLGYDTAERFLYQILASLTTKKSTDVADIELWNDHPKRTQVEVLELFDIAIINAEAVGE